ncbi:protein split ends isoform X2 [Monomorium pharaonis]|uniref:protein split ends isoform X2 n=1 Tax=Monomorium pharaonis TaxID=307658 RepID=UPI0017465470|nr:protein split ends isoform X2 [Monomorium pharaonis]
MVRETRHLWVGNLPENIREDRIREHFKRYGRVQSVKLLPRGEECPVDGGSSSSLGENNEGGSGSSSGGGSGGGGGGSSTSGGASATVAFMDIKSAAKAHATEHTLDERALTTQYYEPQHLQHRFPSHGSSEDHGSGGGNGGGGGGTGSVSGGGSGGGSTGAGVGGSGGGGGDRGDRGSENFDSRGSHGSFYGSERSNRVVSTGSGGGGGGVGGVGSHSADPSTGDYISRNRPPPSSSYHVTSSRARDRLYPRTGPYVSGPPPPPHLDRHRGSLPPSSWPAYEPTSSRYGGAPPPPSPAPNDAYQDEQGGGGSGSTGALRQHKKQRRKSRSGSSSPSGSSRSGSSSSSRSGSSGGSSSAGSTSPGSSPHRTNNVAVTEDRRPLAICVRNLPTRSSDTSLKDGLFHEYKKHGKVTWVKVVGAAGDRYALVCFKKPEDVEKALEVSKDKHFFGSKIDVAPYQGYDVEDNEFRPYEAELDEYHPKATRTLFIGNLEKDVTKSDIEKHFDSFGQIVDVEVKKQGAVSSYAFCQYSDITSVVKAMRSMDGEHLGANRIKLGFGKSMPTTCVWVGGIGDCMSEKYLNMQFHQFGLITQVTIDRERGYALIFFDQISSAQAAVKEMRGVALRGRRLQIDFASREYQDAFYKYLERQGNASEKSWDSRPSPASTFDVTRERSSFDSTMSVSNSTNRFTRYDTPPRSRTASYSRTSGGSTPGASPAHPTAMSRNNRRSYQDSYYDADYGEPTSRRFRSYDEFSQGSGASHDDYQSSVLSDGKLNDDDCPPPSRRYTVQSVVTSVEPAPPPPLLPPPDIRHLQKERVHLLEQLEECPSSGDEVGFVPKKRAKLDSSTTILCEDDEPEITSLLVTSHSSRKGIDFRRVSDSKVVIHHSRRSSCESRGPGLCKRRRDATSRHHEHHDGSRPGTPLVDERPENLVPSEPRRFREKSQDGPLSLPLPRFAAQMLNNNNNTSSSNNNNGSSTRASSASLAKVASPPCASLSTAPSPRAAPQPPASPPPRHASSSPTSSDSETAPQSPSLEERIRSLDEKYEKWSGSRALSAAGGDALAKLDASASERFRFRHKLLDMDLHEVQPSDIVKSVLAKRSVFDEDSKRLENFSEKYEPREFTGVIGVSSMIGSTAGLTTSGGCTSKVCLQYPFPSHPPVQSTSGTSVSQVGINTSLSASLTATTTSMAPSMLKTDPRIVQHNCIHPTPTTPITPGTSIKTVSPELPPVSLPIGRDLVSGTAANSGNGSGLASASSLLSSNGSIGSIHALGASTHRGLSISATTTSPTVTAASIDAFSPAITTVVPITTTSSTVATTTTSVTGAISSMTTTSSIAPPSSITSSSNSSSSSSLSTSSTDLTRSRLRKETSGSSRENRDSRDGKDSRESKHNKGKDCQRRSRKEETDIERNRKDRDEKENSNVSDTSNTDNHSKEFKENKELRYERKEREEKERRDKEDRDRQERKDKEDRERQEKKEREERERREKDEERREKERLDKERQEKDRREREERERERKEREENELKEKERREKERIDRERREREEKERQERREREERERREREERERKEREIRLEREKQEKERLKREREEQERREKEERDKLERERRREEKERLERERKREKEEKERLERERRKEKEEREKMEKEKREKEERERLEKLEREKHEKEKRREREDQERREKEKVDREKRREEKDKEKRERDDSRRQSTENHLHPSITSQSQSQVAPAPVPIKRRCSSQDCPTDEDAKRVKLSDHRRDSKDRSRQNRRSEDRKHRNDSHRSSRESRESRDSKEGGNVTQDKDGTHESTRENNSRDSGNKEKQKSKKNRSEKESRERSPRVSHESDKEFLSRLELSKRNDSSPSTEQSSMGTNHAQQQQSTVNSHSDVDDGPLSTHEIQVARNPSATDTDSDEPKKHSIFDIVDDEPAYISMYDKVKARSTKNMQKLEEEKRQVRLKDKFSQLKQSRARREEKKQSTSWDGDSVSSKALTEDEATSESDSTRTKSLSRKGSRSRIHSDTSEEEEPFNNKIRKTVKTERFLESDVDLGFADTEEKQNPLETSNVIVNSVHTNIKEEPHTSDEDERAVGFRTNHPTIVVNNHERDPRKKSHKKKQKRQKNSISIEENLKVEPNVEHKSKTDIITSNADCRPNHGTESTTVTAATTIVTTTLENAEERMRADKKQRNKKEKRRDRNGEDKAKARRKRLNRQEARDSQRMEDIFGPLSDDVDEAPSNTFFNRFGNMTSENSAYASDSDGGRSSLDMDRVRRKTEKKRRHQPEDENSVDLAEAGREIEAKLLGMPTSPKAAPACTTEPNDHDVFRFTDDNDSVEPSTPTTMPEKVKEKKKKRKKSKEERSRKDYHHHHHHHHHHHEKSGELPYLGAEPSPPRASSPLVSKTISPSLPTSRETLLSPIPKVTSNVSTVSSITPPVVTSNIQTPKSEKKKDKLIPGFGIEIDETIHENAVKSISEPDERDSNCQSRNSREESEVPVPTTPPVQNEDKPRVAISQEETEDAVAALLEETFGASTEDFSYEGEEEETETDGVVGASAEAPQEDVEEMQQAVESLNASTGEGDADMKPDTPQSEHDLQIDTDTEEDPNYETVDLTQPPKTPDIPSFYKSPTKTLPMTSVLTAPEKPVEVRLSAAATKSQSPPSVIAHSWNLNEHNKPREPVKSHQIKTNDSDVDVNSPERTTQRTSVSPPPSQYKQPMLVPCSVPITSDVPKSLSVPSSRPSPITVQPLYQRLPVSPQSQMVPMRQASPKMQNVTTVTCSSSSNTTPLPPLVPSRMPPLVPSQPSPRVSQPLSPNGQWSRNPTLNPHVPNVGKRKSSPPPTKIAVCVPIPAHRPETPVQQIYSTAATQQPVIQHASGMLAPASGYPRGGLPPLTLNIPPRPYMPVPPLASGIQVKSSRDASLSGKSVIETLLPVNPNEPPQRLDEPKLSPAVIPEATNKASTSPKVPSPNQPPTYIPETAKIEINASTSSPVFGKPAYVTDSYTMSSRTQKQISVSITTDSNLMSPRQKQEMSNLQLLTTHVPRSSTPSPVIVAHGQSHLLHKSVHSLGPPTVSSPNQPLIKTVVPIVPQPITSNAAPSISSDKNIISQAPVACQRQSPVSQSQVVKSHIPLSTVSTVSQTIITRVVPSTISSVSTPPMNEQVMPPECLEPRIIQGQQLEMEAEAQINQTVQPMQLTPPIQSTQPIDEIKKELADIEQENIDEATYKAESEKPLNPLCIKKEDVKQEKQEVINTEIASCVPKVEPVDITVPKVEMETLVKPEPMNEIKKEEIIKENDEVELDEEPIQEDPLKEPNIDPLAIDSKEDPSDSKEDSDYWSAKEVNIESVIKKVDALCDGEGNDGDDETQQGNESMNSDSHDTSKNESDWFDAESTEGESKKNFVSGDDHDESVETCENECTRSRRGRTKSRRGTRGGVTTRRGGRNASAVSHRRGGRSSRGSKHHVEKNKLPADVYEFHDDSEEDNAGRPRLILTIKSPGPNVTGPNAQPATPVAAVKEVPPEEFVSPAANTRKSRRLAEKDGSRNTVDDVIEDVVRGSPVNKGLVSGNAGNVHATRRSTRHNNIPRSTTQQSIMPLTELRKSPRSSRKAARRTSENNDDSGEEKMKEVTATTQEAPPSKEEPKLVQPESPKVEEPVQIVTPTPLKTSVSHEPMTLIDPVTGMLIPMRESEEGQYIPVSTSSGQTQAINKTLGESRSGGLPSASSTNEMPRTKSVSESSVLVPVTELKKEAVIEHAPPPTPTQQIQPQTSVITKPQSPAVQVTSTITVAQSSTTGTTIVTTVTATTAPTTTAQPISTSPSQTKPTSLKAHVLNASKLVTSAQQQQVITKPITPSLPNQTIVQNIVKPPAQAIQGLNLQIPPGRVVSPNLSPRTKQAAPLTPTNAKQGQPMSPVLNNTGTPPNPKQHLLQAAKQTSTIVNMPQKLPMNIHPANVNVSTPTPRIHQPVSQSTALKGINGQPHPLNPKTHLLQAVVPPTVANSPTQPHLVNPQQISSVVNSVRPPGPKAPTTGPMEPQKVEVPMSGCIMVPTVSPQSRSVPMPTYEAPMHGSTGATPPGGQYGLVPPHRSQSPPLPPPAHHHANTSQNEVVNHYGGLARDHYLHSPMFQYQYLRAEALTAPRIAYHIPGTRSPHLPLDPKLEPGIEDSHSPPLELRRGTRTPQDRTTDSPQIAQVYMSMHGAMRSLPPPPPQYTTSNPSLSGAPAGARANYYEPPPAHLRSQYPMPASEAPSEIGRAPTPDRCRKHQVVTPPLYASQVPPQADSFQMLLQRHPVMWQGLLALKNDQAAVQMHFVFGNPRVARDSLPCNSDGSTPPLRIAQRMRLEQTQVEGVARKMQTEDEHCMLLALPCGRDEVDVLQQSKNLQTGFIMYLQQKQAAGIVNIAAPGSQQAAYVVHIFPSCDFAHETLARIAPDLHHRVAKIAHLLIVIATV